MARLERHGIPKPSFPQRSKVPAMEKQEQIPGYVRCNATHIAADWSFEVLNEEQRVGLATIETDDGPIHIGLNRPDAKRLLNQLQLFLADWPEDQAAS
jgi:hypothetical protein